MRRLDWTGVPLRRQVEADAREAAARKGAPLPPSAPKIAVTPRHTEHDVLRLPTAQQRRRIVVIRPIGTD